LEVYTRFLQLGAFDTAVIALAVIGAVMVLATGVQVWRLRCRSTQGLLRSTAREVGRRNGDWERDPLFVEIKEKLAPEEWASLDTTMRRISLVPAAFDRATATIACEDVKKVLVRHPELYERFDALYGTSPAARIEALLNGTPRDHADAHDPSCTSPRQSKLSLIRVSSVGQRPNGRGQF
jgi:hypothetical protein